MDRAYATGETQYATAAHRSGYERVPGQPPEERFLDLVYQPIP